MWATTWVACSTRAISTSITPANVLLLPIAGPWVKAAEAADYAQRVGAAVTVPIHDAVLSDAGRTTFDTMLTKAGVQGYKRLNPGEKFTA